ncbi:glycosyltransferase family 4 protein [Corynebacterium riegelii]|uniref:glycosyltransferase family 4 protein n=1 Tax=Corynebacterium riegelii TaxID=156976 RepID=UPI0023F1E532|nr:glycosyltransferase family 4 protein [Corynebacterium riegelii]
MDTQPKVLFCPDLGLLRNPLSEQWVIAFTKYIQESNFDVTVACNRKVPHLEQKLHSLGACVLDLTTPADIDPATDSVPPRFHARSVIREAITGREIQYDIVLTHGLDLSRYVAGGKSLQPVHWSILADDPLRPGDPKQLNLGSVQSIASGARLLLFVTPEARAFVESRVPTATSKTRLLEPILLDSNSTALHSPTNYVFDFARFGSKWAPHSFDALVQEARAIRKPPPILVIDTPSSAKDDPHPLENYPGVRFVESSPTSDRNVSSIHVIPAFCTEHEIKLLKSQIRQNDAILHLTDRVLTLESLSAATQQVLREQPTPFSRLFDSDLPDYVRTPCAHGHPVRVLLAGADFKFAGDLVDSLIQRSDIALSVDLFEANAKPQPKKSQPLLNTADVIIAEFASKNAIWYSQHVRPDQKLIVHLHGYELLQDWITELNIDNCSAIVFASDFYKQKAIDMRGWPEEKLVVIPNSVNFGDLSRAKSPSARFNIGLVGIVPILKRPDRALDLLERLLASDKRFTLHVRGHSPWNYAWEWKKSAHQDSYREFYRRIGSNPELHQRIVFEPFSPDMANWLQDIGWLLSPSTRETFHLSAIEGAASGAVPIAWRREGSEEIIGEEFNFDSTEDAADFIAQVSSNADFERLSMSAQRHASKYSTTEVRAQWLELIFSLQSSRSAQSPGTAADRVLQTVRSAWYDGDPETAISVLDENIPLTRDHRGPLKDAEMFLRGIAAADEKRFTQFLPAQPFTEHENAKIALIRPVGATFDEAELSPGIATFVGVAPPKFVSDEGYEPLADSKIPLEAPNDISIQVDGYLRVDRWFEMVKTRLMPVALSHSELAVQGPWWLALPVLQAADQAGIPSTWFIDDSTTLEWIAKASIGELRTHFGAQIAWNCFQAASVRAIFGSQRLPIEFQIDKIDCCVSENIYSIPRWNPSQPSWVYYGQGSLNRTNAPSVLNRSLASTRVALVSDRALSREWAQHLDTVNLSPDSFMQQLDASFDVAIIHPSANSSGPWKRKLSQPNQSSQCDATKLLDRARLLGATTCFVWESSNPLPEEFWAVARKADAIAVTHPAALQTFLQINPSAVRALAWWNLELPTKNRLELALRGIQLPVLIDRKSIDEIVSVKPLALENFDHQEELAIQELPELERIVVFSDSPAKKWASQTLPSALFEILPLSKLAERSELDFEYFVIKESAEALDENYLLSLWLDASEDSLVISNSADPKQLPPGDDQLLQDCLYPMNCVSHNLNVRHSQPI